MSLAAVCSCLAAVIVAHLLQDFMVPPPSAFTRSLLDPSRPQQPDAVRLASPQPLPSSREMKCDVAIPPESVSITNGVEVFVQSFEAWSKTWRYTVEIHNTGRNPVQMLTRHWLFVDAFGDLQEVKGPGARGETPVILPGGKWNYESGTTLSTAYGSMHGSFQFDELLPAGGRASFNVPVSRLSLTNNGESRATPCRYPASQGQLPTTSVHISHRLIIGATAEYRPELSEDGTFHFTIDVQINSVAEGDMLINAHSWTIIEYHVDRTHKNKPMSGTGLGGYHKLKAYRLATGTAVRYQGGVTLTSENGILEGEYRVVDENGLVVSAKLAPVALSLSGKAIMPRT